MPRSGLAAELSSTTSIREPSPVYGNYRDFLRLSKDWAAANRPHAGIIVSFKQLEPDLVGSSVIALAGLTTIYGEIGLDNCVLALDNYWPD